MTVPERRYLCARFLRDGVCPYDPCAQVHPENRKEVLSEQRAKGAQATAVCARGDLCRNNPCGFIHSARGDLGPARPTAYTRSAICLRALDGRCTQGATTCRYSHPANPAEVLQEYLQKGCIPRRVCRFGDRCFNPDRCSYLHTARFDQPAASDSAASDSAASDQPAASDSAASDSAASDSADSDSADSDSADGDSADSDSADGGSADGDSADGDSADSDGDSAGSSDSAAGSGSEHAATTHVHLVDDAGREVWAELAAAAVPAFTRVVAATYRRGGAITDISIGAPPPQGAPLWLIRAVASPRRLSNPKEWIFFDFIPPALVAAATDPYWVDRAARGVESFMLSRRPV